MDKLGPSHEDAMISLILDHPESCVGAIKFLHPDLFNKIENQYVFAQILQYYDSYNVIPTREMLLDICANDLDSGDIKTDGVMSLIQRISNPREIDYIKQTLKDWAKKQSYKQLFSEESLMRWQNGDFDYIDDLMNKAQAINNIESNAIWFFDQLQLLFEKEEHETLTTGFKKLDRILHDGGPKKKEIISWVAPTGGGKSIMMVNNAIANVMQGKNVVYITLEMSAKDSAVRALGALTGCPVKYDERLKFKDQIINKANKLRSNTCGNLVMIEMPGDATTTNDIKAELLKFRQQHGLIPDVVVVDYMDLVLSNLKEQNGELYVRHKGTATQLHTMAVEENVMVITATQTNRGGNDAPVIDRSEIAESYAKLMPLDYAISINRQREDLPDNIASEDIKLFVIKNRFGKERVPIYGKVHYNNMTIKETT